MPLADLSLDHRVLERLRRGAGPQPGRDLRAALPPAFGELLLRQVVGLHQDLVRTRGLDRVEVGALQILDEGELETIAYVVADDSRDRRLAGDARGEDPSLAGNELVAVAIP